MAEMQSSTEPSCWALTRKAEKLEVNYGGVAKGKIDTGSE
jgi:hypothetical protein